jgi:hypothetical protein
MASGHRSVQATGLMFTGPATLSGLQASSAAASTIVLRDSLDNTGVIVAELELGVNATELVEIPDVKLLLGLHATLTGTVNAVALLD